MSANRYRFALLACTGLALAPAFWAVNTQLGQILPYLDCQQQARYSAIGSAAGAAAACIAAAISWRAARREDAEQLAALTFVGSMGALLALVFAFALLLQGAASLVLSGCER